MSGLCTMRGLAAGAFTLALVFAPQPAQAQPTGDAEALNDEGKELFKERRYLEAYKRFKEATNLSPQGKYFFNLCFSLNYLERFQEAIDACEQVEPNGADAKLLEKTQAVLEALRAKVPAQSEPGDPNTVDPTLGDPDQGDPNAFDPNHGNPNTVDPNHANANVSTGPAIVPGQDPFAITKPAGSYAWSLGASLAPLANLGIGQGAVQENFYAGGGGRLTVFADFMYNQAQEIGLQGFFGVSNLGAAEPDFADALNILDFGAAAYKHIGLTDAIDITPLAGVYVSLMQPDSSQDEALLALGLRAQIGLNWAFGASKEHVASFSPTLNLYSPASDGNALNAADFGLDEGGTSLEIAFGYQYRFTTPFGAGPLFQLE